MHKVLVYYFLEDKSIMIIEPKGENSGVPQGAFLKRQMVLKGDNMTSTRGGVFFDGRFICAMDRNVIPEQTIWSTIQLVPRGAPVLLPARRWGYWT